MKRSSSRQTFAIGTKDVMAALVGRGAECTILGCTEITMLVGAADTSVETFDTTAIHAEAAADFAIG
jgi:aspartate racemase